MVTRTRTRTGTGTGTGTGTRTRTRNSAVDDAPAARPARRRLRVGNAKASKSGNWVKPGNYLVEILGIKFQETESSGDGFIVEFKILESYRESVTNDAGEAILCNVEGDTPSWGCFTKHKSFEGNVKAFGLALLGLSEAEADQDVDAFDEDLENACGEDQPHVGQIMQLEAFITKTKAKTDFTAVNWSHYEEED